MMQRQLIWIKTVTEKILSRDPIEEIKKAFALFDDEGTGKISIRNLRRVAKELGENLEEEELQAMIDEFDLDNDGESMLLVISSLCPYLTLSAVNEQEFIAIMTGNALIYSIESQRCNSDIQSADGDA
jgi:centrin-3